MPNILQHFAWIFLRIYILLSRSVEVEGIENINNIKSNVIIASNHTSEFDPLLLVACLPFSSKHLPLIFVSRERSFYKKNWKRFMYGGTFFRMIGAYRAHAGMNNYEKALEDHIDALNSGKTVCIFPIGRIHQLGETKLAKAGASFLAQKTQLPLVPVLIQSRSDKRTKTKVIFGKPVSFIDIFPPGTDIGSVSSRKHFEKASVALMGKIARLE